MIVRSTLLRVSGIRCPAQFSCSMSKPSTLQAAHITSKRQINQDTSIPFREFSTSPSDFQRQTNMSQSWLPYSPKSHFSIRNIPFGIIETQFSGPRPATIIGQYVLDLKVFANEGGFSELPEIQDHLEVFSGPTLNDFAGLGRPVHKKVRAYLQDVLSPGTGRPHVLKDNDALKEKAIIDQKKTKVKMHLPMKIGDYTDFYAGRNHAYNVGVMFRGPDNALQPNYNHLPVGYHGRASSVVVSGTPITRPLGQTLNPETKKPQFGPSKRLDIELEMGVLLCKNNSLGEPISVETAEKEYVFGYVLLNDWSARDIQAWEYVPLGPFNGKNFGTSVSAWVVMADALEPFRAKGLDNPEDTLPYLKEREDKVFDINLEVELETPSGDCTTISRVSSSQLLWSFPQMIAHHSIGGCPLSVGDLLGSGTISGTTSSSLGSMLEMSEGGKKDIMLAGMDTRTFLSNGDIVRLSGVCGEEGELVGFGSCEGKILASPNVDEVLAG